MAQEQLGNCDARAMAELSWQAEPIPLWYHKGMSRQGLRAIVTQELCAIATQELCVVPVVVGSGGQ